MTMPYDSPEDALGPCPQCGAEVHVDPSRFYGDVDCPRCNVPLWFLQHDGRARLYERAWAASRIAGLLKRTATELGVAPAELAGTPALLDRLDSIAFVEFIMELESELDSSSS